ncbi:helix-turn-helix domain-containing protein [Streptomyces sp. KS_5]|uniref:winged helix-turn-helix transcriptional regulator n=1 Tax=Streptomyces sp. KS_5 TaxID=1881018 RepID=UPI000A5E2873|nr:helix-turn-helix domain-containing protein [Streptomyces sp. KS_5]
MSDALEVLGDQYSLPVLRELHYGFHRFSELATLTGAPRSLLSGRLRRLEEAGVIEKRQYSQRPVRHEYHLTSAGADLLPVILTLKEWGERHLGGGVAKTVLQHACGAELHPVTSCGECRSQLHPGEVAMAGGATAG